MNPRSLQTVLRTLAAAEPPAADGELLRRFVGGDEAAFAELVRRHGRLVWAVCRHLTRSDAEADDAFQATFLVLLRNAGKVRDPERLSAWLHGVAYKVCGAARRANHRRAARERVAAAPERNGSAVPDSAWDRALAAVHEEAGRLPESLRVPFVLCCLEGKGVTEAADQLGWKLGTLSGRLTRAKAAILARLDARGLTLGAVAGLGLAAPPAEAMAKAAALARAGAAIPNAILQLSQGVIGMTATPFKLLAAAVLVGGLGLGLGTGWTPTADAQSPKPSSPKPDPQAEVKRLQAELEKARAAAKAADAQREADLHAWRARMVQLGYLTAAAQKEKPSAATPKWEYDFFEVKPLGETELVKFLHEREAQGWEFVGTTPVVYFRANEYHSPPVQKWVFRRPVKWPAPSLKVVPPTIDFTPKPAGEKVVPPAPDLADYYYKLSRLKAAEAVGNPKADDPKAIEAEIAKLQKQLAELKAKGRERAVAVFKGAELPLGQTQMINILKWWMDAKKLGGRVKVMEEGDGIRVQGDQEAVELAAALIKKLNEK